MRTGRHSVRRKLAAAVLLTIFGAVSVAAFGQAAVKLSGSGTLTYVPGGISTMTLAGTASHLGLYTCYAELIVDEGTDGSLTGIGVADFKAANGDHLVGIVEFQQDAAGEGSLHFSWQDEVSFSNGTVRSSGRFVKFRPPGVRARIGKCCPVACLPICICICD
jgi:hypothetical protein